MSLHCEHIIVFSELCDQFNTEQMYSEDIEDFNNSPICGELSETICLQLFLAFDESQILVKGSVPFNAVNSLAELTQPIHS